MNLRFCEGLTDTGLVELALGVGKSLKSLGVAACTKITDISMEAVGSHCRSLENLSLESETIHNKGLLAVSQGCPALKVLKLHCFDVTDDALKAVGTNCLLLELLALYSFQRFTDKCVSRSTSNSFFFLPFYIFLDSLSLVHIEDPCLNCNIFFAHTGA